MSIVRITCLHISTSEEYKNKDTVFFPDDGERIIMSMDLSIFHNLFDIVQIVQFFVVNF